MCLKVFSIFLMAICIKMSQHEKSSAKCNGFYQVEQGQAEAVKLFFTHMANYIYQEPKTAKMLQLRHEPLRCTHTLLIITTAHSLMIYRFVVHTVPFHSLHMPLLSFSLLLSFLIFFSVYLCFLRGTVSPG